MGGLIDYHCVNHHVKMGKLLLLALLFLAFIPGVLLTVNFGFKNPMVANVVHAFAFAFVYSVISHLYWSHLRHKKMKMARHLEQAIMAEIQMEQMAQLKQMVHHVALQNTSTKCSEPN
jgi:hypothetical protein